MLQHLVYSMNYDIACICETWFNDTVMNSGLLPGYSVFRCVRLEGNGGGVLVAVKENIQEKNVEWVVVQLRTECNKPTLLYTLYRPPNSSPDIIQQLN